MAAITVTNSGKTTLLDLADGKALQGVVVTPDGDDVELFINGELVASATARDGDPTPLLREYGITKVEGQAVTDTAACYVNQAGA